MAETPKQMLARLTAAAKVPVLDDPALDALLEQYALADASGLLPSDTGWVPTYDMNGAAKQGWLDKAALVAGSFDIGAGTQKINRSQMVQACLGMAKMYGKRRAGSGRMQGAVASGDTGNGLPIA